MAFLYWIRHRDHTDIFSEGYVGITVRPLSQRMANHKHAAKVESKQHLPIYRAINKYGFSNLIIETIVDASEDYVTELEIKLRPTSGIGWNCAMGGQDTGRGRVQSEEEKAKRAVKAKGRKHTEEAKARMSASAKGIPKSPEHKEKCRVAALGHKQSPESLARRSITMTGKRHSDLAKSKISAAKSLLNEWSRSKSNKSLWVQAQKAHSIFIDCKANFTMAYLGSCFDLPYSAVRVLHRKLKAGWNPSEDSAYLEWLSKYKEEMEAVNGTRTTPTT